MKHLYKILAGTLALTLLLTSCMSIQLSRMSDDELAQAGADLWNANKAEDARPYWSNIKDEAVRTKYLSAYDKIVALETAVEAAVAVDPTKDTEAEAAFDTVVRLYKEFPSNLNIPEDLKPRLWTTAENIVKKRVRDQKFTQARAFMAKAIEFLGPTTIFAPYEEQMAAFAREKAAFDAVAARERSADTVYANAQAVDDFNDKIVALENAFTTFRAVEDFSAQQMRAVNAPANSTMVAQLAGIRKKRSDTRVLIERQLRERQYSFKERIGEIFARQPEASKIGNMRPDEILAFNEGIRRDINVALEEMVAFGTKYPTVLDADMITDTRTQAAALDRRIAQIAQEVRRIRDIESRGKAALPLMIGLFNLQPGSTGAQQRSRPAVLRGTMAGNNDYWWGMISIEPRALNDLVVTMRDSREVQIFSENTMSGARIVPNKLTNLVSRANRIGNSWPVINAGAVLPNDQYYIQLSKGASNSYQGEVVIYSSFIARVR